MLTENICLSIEFWMIRKKSLTMGGKLTTSTNRWRLSVNPNVICSSWYLLCAAIIPGFLMFTWSGSFCGRYTGGFSTTLELPIVINASSKHSTVCHGMTLSSFYKFQILNLHITEKIPNNKLISLRQFYHHIRKYWQIIYTKRSFKSPLQVWSCVFKLNEIDMTPQESIGHGIYL